MFAISGLLGLVLMCGEPKNSDSKEFIQVRMRVVDLKGVEWRGPIHNELKPAGRKGTSTIWITDQATANAIHNAAERSIAQPMISVSNGVSATVSNGTSTSFVADLERVADGPPGKNTQLAYKPEIETARDGVTTQLVCRTTADGTRMQVTIDESRILAVHVYSIPDSVVDPKTGKTAQTINAQAQVPEIVTCRVEGEWLVPKDGVLVVSLGARSSTYEGKKDGVHERVLLFEPSSKRVDTGAIKATREVLANWVEDNASRKSTIKAPTRVLPAPVNVSSAPILMPVPLPVLPLLASPTVAPKVKWKASLQVAYGTTPPNPPEDGVMACLPLTLLNMPLALPNTWIGVAVEPMKREARPAMKAATPPTRNLPQWSMTGTTRNGTAATEEDDLCLPPLPDEHVQVASGEVLAAPQAAHVLIAKPRDTTVARVAAFVGSGQEFQFKEHVKEDVVLFPATKPLDTVDCPEAVHARVTRKVLNQPVFSPDPLSGERLAEANRRVANLKYFTASNPARCDELTSLLNFPKWKLDADNCPSEGLDRAIEIMLKDGMFKFVFDCLGGLKLDEQISPIESTPGPSPAGPADLAPEATYFVLGEVKSPGRLILTGNQTVLDALKSAGGLDDPRASVNSIRLARAAKPGSPKIQDMWVDVPALMQKGDMTTNYPLMANDRIFVYGKQTAASEKSPEPSGMTLPSAYPHRDVEYFPPGPDVPWVNTQEATRRASFTSQTPTDAPSSLDSPVKTLRGSTLSVSLKGADGVCESNSEVRLKVIEAQPFTLRVPMADGSIVEIQARVVKPAKP